MSRGLIGLVVGVAVFCLLGGVLAIVLLSGGASGPAGVGKTAEMPRGGSAAGPWPECEAIVRWFRENVGDPNALQIVKWLSRTVYDRQGTMIPFGTVLVRVKIRGKNTHGALAVACREFRILDGKITYTTEVDCND